MDPTKTKLIELIPEIVTRASDLCRKVGDDHAFKNAYIEITLADVLRAIGKSYSITFAMDTHGAFEWRTFMNGEVLVRPCGVQWNLTKDFDGQAQETKEFIGRLINAI